MKSDYLMQKPDLDSVNRPGEHFLYDHVTGEIHELNATAMAIWEALDGSTSLDEIVDAIVALTENPRPTVKSMARKTLEEFVERGLASPVPSP